MMRHLPAVLVVAATVTGCVATPESRIADVDPVALEGSSFAVRRYDTSTACTHDFRAEALSLSPDGDVRWRMDVPWTPDPTPAIADGVAVVGGNTDVFAFDVATGEPRWQIGDLPGNRLVATDDGTYLTILVGGIGGAVVRIDPAGGEPLWSFVPDSEVGSMVVSDGERLYITDGGDLGALDATTGDTVWKHPTDQAFVPPLIAPGVLVERVFPHEVVGVDPVTGDELWRTDLGSAVLEQVALSAGVAVAVVDDAVVGLDVAAGGELWRMAVIADTEIVAVGPELVHIHRGDVIENLDPVTGAVASTLPGPGQPGPLAVAAGFVADVFDGVWRVRPLDAAWEATVGPAHRLVLSPAGDRLYVSVDEAVDDIAPDGQGRLLALDPATGEVMWELQTRDGVGTAPRPVGENLLVVASDRGLGC